MVETAKLPVAGEVAERGDGDDEVRAALSRLEELAEREALADEEKGGDGVEGVDGAEGGVGDEVALGVGLDHHLVNGGSAKLVEPFRAVEVEEIEENVVRSAVEERNVKEDEAEGQSDSYGPTNVVGVLQHATLPQDVARSRAVTFLFSFLLLRIFFLLLLLLAIAFATRGTRRTRRGAVVGVGVGAAARVGRGTAVGVIVACTTVLALLGVALGAGGGTDRNLAEAGAVTYRVGQATCQPATLAKTAVVSLRFAPRQHDVLL